MSLRMIFFAAGLTLLSGCGSSQPISPDDGFASSAPSAPAIEASAAVSVDPRRLEALEATIKAEPKVKDFVYDPHAVVQWTIGVADDGSARYGYAEYVCALVKEHGLQTSSTTVRIVDYNKFMRNGGDARESSLGAVECATSRQMMP